jgi:hypothetical protein
MLYKRGRFYWLDIRINGNRFRLKLRNDFEGLGLELEYEKLVKKFAFNTNNEF